MNKLFDAEIRVPDQAPREAERNDPIWHDWDWRFDVVWSEPQMETEELK